MISIIVPTYNERKNIVRLIMEVESALIQSSITDFEILVMDDDSPDQTADHVIALKDPKVRLVNRRGRVRGLSNAVIDGFREARGEILGVMDADLSHPPAAVPSLVEALAGDTLIAVGSRYVRGGGIVNWPLKRRIVSRVACWLACGITPVRDSTSGFFFLKREVLGGVTLDPYGFKIGLEVFARTRHAGKIKEIPYVFTDRREGQSKFGPSIITTYLKQLVHLAGEKIRHGSEPGR
jgi:dolichol-phosphate mannosyltransferase